MINKKDALSSGQSSGESDKLSVSLGSHFTIYGTRGADSLHGSAFSDWIYGYAGNDTLYGNGGKDRLIGGTGDDMLAGGSGKDEFVFAAGDGNDTILDFEDGSDIVNLASMPGVDSFQDLIGGAMQAGDDVVLDFGNGSSITLKNIDISALTAADFIF